MKKIDLGQTITILANVGVIAGIFFLAFELQQNTATIEAAEERAFLESWRELTQLPFYADEGLAQIQLNVHSGESLTPLEAKRWENYLRAVFDTWWQLHNSHASGLISDQSWNNMNDSILTLWELERMGEFWVQRGRHYAGTPFGEHIETEVARMR